MTEPDSTEPTAPSMDAWRVKPVQRDGNAPAPHAAPGAAQQTIAATHSKIPERDLFAEAQVRGIALVVFAVCAVQLIAAVLLGIAGSATGNATVEAKTQVLAFLPALVLWVVLVGQVSERRSFPLTVGFPVGTFAFVGVWAFASIGHRFALSMACCAGISFFLGLGLWRLGPFARWFTVAWAGLALYGPVRFFLDGMAKEGAYLAVAPAVILLTLLWPRVANVFGDTYGYHASRDPRSVPLLTSVPMWVCAAWSVLPILALLGLAAQVLR